VVEGHGGRLVAQQRRRIRRKEKLLRVVFEDMQEKYVVITAYLTADIERYWKDKTP
jgi:ubiquinone/menaquinone biosynthesis C-methylase UbiE